MFRFDSMLRILSLVCLIAMAVSCSSPKYALSDLPKEQLHFSYGGGFTGEYQEFLLLKNGQIFKRTRVIRPTSFTPLQPLKKKEAKELFKTFEDQKFANLEYNDPGNMTYTIKMIGEVDTSQVVWGGVDVQPNLELKSYWRRLMKFVTDRPEIKEEPKKKEAKE